jgi:hypothetical protein
MRRLSFTEKQSNVGITPEQWGALSMGILPTKTVAVQCYLVTFDIAVPTRLLCNFRVS